MLIGAMTGGRLSSGGTSVAVATVAASIDLEGRPWKDLSFDNSAGSQAAVVALALSGTNPGNFSLRDASNPATVITELAIPAGGSASVRVKRSGSGSGSATLTATHGDGTTATVSVSADAQNTLLQNAAQIGGAATHAWSFPAVNPENDQVGSAHFSTFSGRAGNSPFSGCDGYVDLANGDCDLTQTADMGRQADRTLEIVISFDAQPSTSRAILVWGREYDEANMFAQILFIDGGGTPDDGDIGNANALRVQGPGYSGNWQDSPGVALVTVDRDNQDSSLSDIQNKAIYLAVTYNATTKKHTTRYKKEGDQLRSHTSAAFASAGGDPTGEFASLGGNVAGNISRCNECHVHHLAFYDQVLTDAEVKEQLEILGIGE